MTRLGPALLLFAAYWVAFEWLHRSARLPIEAYGTPVVAFAWFRHLVTSWKLSAFAIVAGAVCAWRWREMRVAWSELDRGSALRFVAATATIAIAWPLATAAYNNAIEHWHAIDRIVLVGLAIGVVSKPVFMLPFVVWAAPMSFEYQSEWHGYSWSFFAQPLRIMTLLACWLAIRAHRSTVNARVLTFVLIALIASHYWVPGLSKLRQDWFTSNDVHNLLPAAHGNGWLGFVDDDAIGACAAWLAHADVLLRCVTFVVECGCIGILLGGRVGTAAFLVAFACFHVGIFVVSGICLWQWACTSLVVGVLALRRRLPLEPRFDAWHLALSLALIGTAPVWLRSAPLTWFDAPVKYVYRFVAIQQDGSRHRLPPGFFAPYDRQFALGAFDHLVADRPLLWCDGRETAHALKNLRSPEAVFEYEAAHATPRHDPARVRAFEHFVRTFVSNWQRHPDRGSWLRWIAPPPGVVTSPRSPTPPLDGPVRRVDVEQVTVWSHESTYAEIRALPVLSIAITGY